MIPFVYLNVYLFLKCIGFGICQPLCRMIRMLINSFLNTGGPFWSIETSLIGKYGRIWKMSEDDTFKALRRTPRNYIRQLEKDWLFDYEDRRRWAEVLNAHGWTEEEYYEWISDD